MVLVEVKICLGRGTAEAWEIGDDIWIFYARDGRGF